MSLIGLLLGLDGSPTRLTGRGGRTVVTRARYPPPMRLLLIRHAIAMDRVKFAELEDDDRLRPLTGKGRRRMEKGVRGLATLVPEVDLLVTSPLLRARQTSEIVAGALRAAATAETPALRPEAEPAELLDWLEGRDEQAETVAVVGHEPHLSALAGYLLTGRKASLLEMKKGAACLLELPSGHAVPGAATLLWALPPRTLRELA